MYRGHLELLRLHLYYTIVLPQAIQCSNLIIMNYKTLIRLLFGICIQYGVVILYAVHHGKMLCFM